jgi:homoserine dehydrogenase
MRVCIIGFGTVGRWVVEALGARAAELRSRYGTDLELVGIANSREGLVFRDGGLDPTATVELAAEGRAISEYPGVQRWTDPVEGLRAIEIDLLVETSASPAETGEPGLTHMREALNRGVNVVTSNKWPVAIAGVELADLAERRGVAFRAEATVMSGTPVLGPLTEGLAGATPRGLRAVLNATANSILTTMRSGTGYATALAEAQAAGLAEPDPAADVEGHDSVAKLMILSALTFGHQLRAEDVSRRGIAALTEAEIASGRDPALRLRELAQLDIGSGSGGVRASVEPALLEAAEDPLAPIDGTMNAIIVRADPLGEIRLAGPGAGPRIAGQGVLSDLIALARGMNTGLG